MNRTPASTVAENGPPPSEAASLYPGKVMHARMKPKTHRFSYSVFSLMIDLDRLAEAGSASRFFSVGRFNLVSFFERDHGQRDGTSLRRYIDEALAEHGIDCPSRVLLLAYPRILGYVFNPLAVYYCYGSGDDLTAIVYEVRNTFGDIHSYVLPVSSGQSSAAGVRQRQDKRFYVSPFISMTQTYHFRMLPPGRSVRVRILETDPEGPLLSATFSGEQRPLTTRSILALCFRIPLMTVKVVSAIHWEAFKIWRKRVRFHRRPKAGPSDLPRTDRPGTPHAAG
jgi:DUF1365 family protein